MKMPKYADYVGELIDNCRIDTEIEAVIQMIEMTLDEEFFKSFVIDFYNEYIKEQGDISFVSDSGTGYWYSVFKRVCVNNMRRENLFKIYNNLTWYDSDNFDGHIAEVAEYYKLIPSIKSIITEFYGEYVD